MKELETSVLVTGGAGFIGSHLVKRLVNEGARVSVIDNETGSNLDEVREKIWVYNVDLRYEKDVEAAVREIAPKKVFHLAAHIDRRRSLNAAQELIDNNITGTKNLLEALENTDYEVIVSAGTCEEYGNNPAPFTEQMREEPASPYSLTKTCIAQLLRMRDNSGGGKKKAVILRPTIVYGPSQKNNLLIPAVITAALEKRGPRLVSGKQTRDFLYVDDMVEAYISASITPRARGEIINIGSGSEISVKDIVVKILTLMGEPITAEFGTMPDPQNEIYSYYANIAKAKRVMNWEAKTGLEEGLKQTIGWYSRMYELGRLSEWEVTNERKPS